MTPLLEDFGDRRQLADETRRLLRALRRTTASAPDRAKAQALLVEAAAILEADRDPHPLWQTGLERFEQFSLDTPLERVFPYSPSLGQLNPMAPQAELEVLDDRTIRGTVTFTDPHNGPPFDLTHGGIIALVYDELLGMAAMVGAGGGLTANLSIDYRAVTPMHVPIEVMARMGEHEGRKFLCHGEMHHDGVLLTQAKGLFVFPRAGADVAWPD